MSFGKKPQEMVLKAYANEKRVEILNYIKKEHLVIKSDIIKQFDLKRAALDHHLNVLAGAGLIEIKDMKINNKQYSFVYPVAEIKVEVLPLLEAEFIASIPEEITKESYQSLTRGLWLSEENADKSIVSAILTKIIERLDLQMVEYLCWKCREAPGIVTCSNCGKLYCTNCIEIITKAEGDEKIIICYNCIEEQFS
ncbi:MAG: ArsR family transcriptional regulator [Candidatus Odinarchaeota archaeon]